MNAENIKTRLARTFPEADIEVFDLTGGGDHFEVTIASSSFAGQNRIRQHQSVMDVFKQELASGELHAFSIRTSVKSPEMTPTKGAPS